MNDYRKLKKEIRLGGLGPDLDNETNKEKVLFVVCIIYIIHNVKTVLAEH